MKYAFLIYEDETVYGPDKAGPELQEIVGQHMAFSQALGSQKVSGGGLKASSTATVVRTSGGKKQVHDGPFAEAREQLGGFYVIEAADLDEAIALGKKIPIFRDGAVEIRPLLGA